MRANHAHAQGRDQDAVPLWLRRGTLWVIVALTIAFGALVAYYLLPGWWAGLVNLWVRATSPWATGLLLGFIPVTIGLAALRTALRLSPRDREEGRGAWAHYLRPLLGAVAGVCLVAVLLTVSIAAGPTQPLRAARTLWQYSAPGVLAATLVGGLLAVIAVLGYYSLRMRLRQGKPPAPDTAGEDDDVTRP